MCHPPDKAPFQGDVSFQNYILVEKYSLIHLKITFRISVKLSMSMNYEYELSVPKQFKTDDKEQVINVMSEPLLTEDPV